MLFVYFRQASKNVNVKWREPAVRTSKGKIYNMRRELMINVLRAGEKEEGEQRKKKVLGEKGGNNCRQMYAHKNVLRNEGHKGNNRYTREKTWTLNNP
jgi:hypothetical protein